MNDVCMTIYGLHDDDDILLLEDALRCLLGVVSVVIDPAAGQAHIRYDQSHVGLHVLTAAIERAGYVGPITATNQMCCHVHV